MALHRTVVLVDDLDGSQAECTVAFSLDGEQYEIDLSTPNVQRLHDALAPFMTAARVTGGEPGLGRARRPRVPRTRVQPTPPAAVKAADASTSGNQTGTSVRPPVPGALFSNPTQPLPPRAVPTAKPDAAQLFSPAS